MVFTEKRNNTNKIIQYIPMKRLKKQIFAPLISNIKTKMAFTFVTPH